MGYLMDARRRHQFDRGETQVPAELATTTFGAIDKYVAANDNIDVRRFGAKGGVVSDESRASAGFGVCEPRGGCVGLRRNRESV